MKKLSFALLMLTSLAAFAPKADAGQYRKIFRGYDRCGEPIYRYVRKYSYCEPAYQAPRCYAPSRSYYRGYDSGYYRGRERCYESRPRLSFSFGF